MLYHNMYCVHMQRLAQIGGVITQADYTWIQATRQLLDMKSNYSIAVPTPLNSCLLAVP